MSNQMTVNIIGLLAILSCLCIALWMIGTKTDLNEARINVLESKQVKDGSFDTTKDEPKDFIPEGYELILSDDDCYTLVPKVKEVN